MISQFVKEVACKQFVIISKVLPKMLSKSVDVFLPGALVGSVIDGCK